LIRKPKGKRLLGRHRHKWEDIKMVLGEREWDPMDWLMAGSTGRLL
jgi:hypothetical protein